jgi:hypothetical protein
MLKMSRLYYVLLILGLLAFVSCEEEEDTLTEGVNSSEFYNDADGWTIEGDAEGGSSIDAAYSPFNGLDNSGHIYAEDDVTGGVWYFVAPGKYLGNKTSFLGGSISLWLIQESAMDDQFYSKDVILEGSNGSELYYEFDSYPSTNWTYYEISLDTTSVWLNQNEDTASMADFETVLNNLQKLWIRGEYQTGEDTGGLDKFQLKIE